MGLFKKQKENAKTKQPGDYHKAGRQAIWVPFRAKQSIERYSKATNRSIPVAIADLIAIARPFLAIWVSQSERKAYLEIQIDSGKALVHVLPETMDFIGAFARKNGVSKGNALDEIVFMATLIIEKEQRSRAAKRVQREKPDPGLFNDLLKDIAETTEGGWSATDGENRTE